LIEDGRSYTLVMETLTRYSPELTKHLNGQAGLTLRQAASLNARPADLLVALEAALLSGHPSG
jgi:hypothetical protein